MRLDFCVACGSIDGLHQHHLVPRSLGGADEDDNLITICERCHCRVHGLPLNIYDLSRRGLKRAGVRMVDDYGAQIIEAHGSGESITALAGRYGFSDWAVRRYLIKRGFHIPTPRQEYRAKLFAALDSELRAPNRPDDRVLARKLGTSRKMVAVRRRELAIFSPHAAKIRMAAARADKWGRPRGDSKEEAEKRKALVRAALLINGRPGIIKIAKIYGVAIQTAQKISKELGTRRGRPASFVSIKGVNSASPEGIRLRDAAVQEAIDRLPAGSIPASSPIEKT